MYKRFKIKNKSIGKDQTAYIVFEAGPTHRGFESAKNLIKMAKKAGADAIKFQMFDTNRLISNKTQKFQYEILINKKKNKFKKINESLYKIFKRRELKKKQWAQLAKLCRKLNIGFFATCGFSDEIKFLKKIGCDSIKIASADVNHIPLIKEAARTNLCIQLDTGMSTLDEIKNASKVLKKNGCKKMIIHHCPSGYPANSDNINLNILKTLRKKFNCPIAYSDHSIGYELDLVAFTHGAHLLEKTITENRMTKSVEHIMSLEFQEMKKFVDAVRMAEKAFGAYRRKLSTKDIKQRNLLRRSAFFTKKYSKNTLLSNCQIAFKRPGIGIQPDEFEKIKNMRRLKRDVNIGEIVLKRNLI